MLDEPTSGLDSFTANEVGPLLVRVACGVPPASHVYVASYVECQCLSGSWFSQDNSTSSARPSHTHHEPPCPPMTNPAGQVISVVKLLVAEDVTVVATIHSPTAHTFSMFDRWGDVGGLQGRRAAGRGGGCDTDGWCLRPPLVPSNPPNPTQPNPTQPNPIHPSNHSVMILIRGRVVYFGENDKSAIGYVSALPMAAAVAPYRPGLNDAVSGRFSVSQFPVGRKFLVPL
jgi:hypothetical protein